jgi:hypothetical protein
MRTWVAAEVETKRSSGEGSEDVNNALEAGGVGSTIKLGSVEGDCDDVDESKDCFEARWAV